MSRIRLPQVTVCCVDTRDPDLALATLRRAQAIIDFGAAVLCTDTDRLRADHAGIRVVEASIRSIEDYSRFMLTGLADLVDTTHALVVQWDGFPTRPERWDDRFLEYDYIGAPWPGFPADLSVGNGGFSLRSRRLLAALAEPGVATDHPEDVAICHTNRPRLERLGMRFAPLEVAERFSYERLPPTGRSFGYHGLFNWVHEFPARAMAGLIDELPDRLTMGLDGRDLIERLVACGDLDNAARLLAKRQRAGAWDRRTLKLWSRLYWAGYRSRAA